ncbi:MAG: hypothetical protein GQ564_00580 [Bacteroidales bacterium]|nr:hypothetical protein [Bacteroidales bacterium]
MKNNRKYTGFAIAIAWPETYCKQPGSWYDPITLLLGINKNNYYKAGHAALVLVDIENQKCHYFDFGRYHSPFGHGRVRSAETDHELKMKTFPKISEDKEKLENFREILLELQQNAACHGEGALYASYTKINFQSAFKEASRLQEISPIPYGPFKFKGSNCSRFVNSALLAGNPSLYQSFQLKYLVPLTPTPISNVNSFKNKIVLPKILKTKAFIPEKKLSKNQLKSTLQEPEKNPKIPKNAQWLSGEGAGSWFDLNLKNSKIKLTKYSPEGLIECTGLYENIINSLDHDFQITHPSNCKEVTIIKNKKLISLESI